ncbi:MAG: Gfo/Idh/MocA family oxidoreductase [Phycisphaerales bacterium]|nr:Gfo/Idh/MocA family oxidoreductase [Phycisphaerales bacterium]
MAKAKKKEYGIKQNPALKQIAAPVLAYEPPRPRRYNPPIGLIGCGGISASHLGAYKKMGLNIVALCDKIPGRAENRRKEFFPGAQVYSDYHQLLKRDEIEVVDIATHPSDREYLIPAAISAGKHVLSQKPFVTKLDKGEEFAELAEKKGVVLAVNQNGRWAPHVSYMRQAVNKGLIGQVAGAHLRCSWDHEWVRTTDFNRLHHVILFDYAIHWFDMINCYIADKKPLRCFSTLMRAGHQKSTPPLLGQTLIEFEGAHASLVFDAAVSFGQEDVSYLTGSKGTLISRGENILNQPVSLYTGKGYSTARLKGQWFVEGFMGTMGELLCAIEQKRQPINNPRNNLRGLAMCFAAVKSAETGKPQVVGQVRSTNPKTCRVAPK